MRNPPTTPPVTRVTRRTSYSVAATNSVAIFSSATSGIESNAPFTSHATMHGRSTHGAGPATTFGVMADVCVWPFVGPVGVTGVTLLVGVGTVPVALFPATVASFVDKPKPRCRLRNCRMNGPNRASTSP